MPFIRTCLTVILLCCTATAFAQSNFIPLSTVVEQPFQRDLYRVGNGIHTSMRPFLRSDITDAALFAKDSLQPEDRALADVGSLYDSLVYIATDSGRRFNRSWFGRKLFTEHLLAVKGKDYRLYLDPAFEFAGGVDRGSDSNFYYNTRGVWVNGSIGKRFGFNASFYENLSTFPVYLDSSVSRTRIVPGQGRVKRFGSSNFDYAFVTGAVNFQLNRHFTFEFGQDRHFIGDGYRSLLLSDNAFHYPYIKIIADFWKIRYVHLLTEMRDLTRIDNNDEAPFKKKYTSMHYLDINIGKHASVGIFEAVVWSADTLTGARGIDLGYLNPFVFLRPVEFSIGSPDNVLLGLNFKVLLNSRNTLYGQVMLDEFLLANVRAGNGWWANKQGLQAGFKSMDVFGVKNLYLQGEANYVRPYTYQHRTAIGTYSHYRAPLAHPLGANFWELVGIARYNYKRWHVDARCSYALAGYDTAGSNWGQNVLISYVDREQEFNNKVGQGVETRIMWMQLNLSYLLNPNNQMRVFADLGYRGFSQPTRTTNTLLIQGGIRTNLFNRYYDF